VAAKCGEAFRTRSFGSLFPTQGTQPEWATILGVTIELSAFGTSRHSLSRPIQVPHARIAFRGDIPVTARQGFVSTAYQCWPGLSRPWLAFGTRAAAFSIGDSRAVSTPSAYPRLRDVRLIDGRHGKPRSLVSGNSWSHPAQSPALPP